MLRIENATFPVAFYILPTGFKPCMDVNVVLFLKRIFNLTAVFNQQTVGRHLI